MCVKENVLLGSHIAIWVSDFILMGINCSRDSFACALYLANSTTLNLACFPVSCWDIQVKGKELHAIRISLAPTTSFDP